VSHPYGGQPATGYGDAGATSYVPTAETNQAQYLDDGQPMTADGHPDVEGTSVGTLISEVTRDLSTLMRQEVELAKAEIRADANKATAEIKAQGGKAGKGAGMLVGAGYGGHMLALS
jgi:hypothetical protein